MLTPQGALNASLNKTLFRRRTPRRRLSKRRPRQESAAVVTGRAGLREAPFGLAGLATTESLRHLSFAAPDPRSLLSWTQVGTRVYLGDPGTNLRQARNLLG